MPFSSLVYSIVTVLSGLFWWLGLLTNTEWQLFLIYCNFQVMSIGHLQCIPKTWCCLYKYKLLQTCQCWSWISITWFQIKNASNDSLWSYPVPLILLMLLQRKKKKLGTKEMPTLQPFAEEAEIWQDTGQTEDCWCVEEIVRMFGLYWGCYGPAGYKMPQ